MFWSVHLLGGGCRGWDGGAGFGLKSEGVGYVVVGWGLVGLVGEQFVDGWAWCVGGAVRRG